MVSDGDRTYRTPFIDVIAHPSPPAGLRHLVSMGSHSRSLRSYPYRSLCATESIPGRTSLPPNTNMTPLETHAQCPVLAAGGSPAASTLDHEHLSKSKHQRSFRQPNCPCPPKT